MYRAYYYYDYVWIILVPAIIFVVYTWVNVKRTYKVYSEVRNSTGITGAEAARRILDANGLSEIDINILDDDYSLNNYYDPLKRSLNLLKEVYESNSVSFVAIACHEAARAMQYEKKYTLLVFRNAMVPVINIIQNFSYLIMVLGILLLSVSPYGKILFVIGAACFVLVILFHLATLRVENDAADMALDQMRALKMCNEEDDNGSKAVLKATSMRHIAALATVRNPQVLRVFHRET